MTEDYEQILELVADNPGITRDDCIEIAADRRITAAADLLDQALEKEDVLELNGRHWIVRKGRFAFNQYDHPET